MCPASRAAIRKPSATTNRSACWIHRNALPPVTGNIASIICNNWRLSVTARELGLDTETIRRLLELARDPAAPCQEADDLVRHHIELIDARIRRFRATPQPADRAAGSLPRRHRGRLPDPAVADSLPHGSGDAESNERPAPSIVTNVTLRTPFRLRRPCCRRRCAPRSPPPVAETRRRCGRP